MLNVYRAGRLRTAVNLIAIPTRYSLQFISDIDMMKSVKSIMCLDFFTHFMLFGFSLDVFSCVG